MFNSIWRYINGEDEDDINDGAVTSSSTEGCNRISGRRNSSGSSYSRSTSNDNDQYSMSSSEANMMQKNCGVSRHTFEEEKGPDYKSRTKLPAIMVQREQISIWSILKQSIGKELSKITMPVVFNEPLSFLQRLTEYMEYCDLLYCASKQNDPVKRMEYVAAFAVSALAANWDRVAKPFNPLLLETYELDRTEDLGFRIICEQVSHHPPVSAFHADGPVFRFHGSIYPKLKFWGRSVEIQPRGVITLELMEHKETYTWTNVNCSVHNLVMGKPYIEQHGILEIINHSNGLKCTLNFKPSSNWFGRDCSNHIEGHITDKQKKKLRAFYGEWTEFLASCPVEAFDQSFATWGKEHRDQKNNAHHKVSAGGASLKKAATLDGEGTPENCVVPKKGSVIPLVNGSELLWRVQPRPPCSDDFYHFTSFAMMLNDKTDKKIPCTDSRLRPDMRCMEEGNLDEAANEKNRLEEKQRGVRSQRRKEKLEDETSPMWFSLEDHPLVKEKYWRFSGKYWERNWNSVPNIF